MRTYDEIKAAQLAKDHKWFDGELNVNIVFERADYMATNHFTDWMHIAYTEDGENKVISIHASTKPGTTGSLDRVNQPLVDGVVGTACIKAGQYLGSHRFRDFPYVIDANHPVVTALENVIKCPYLRQVGPMNYFRDGNRDAVIDEVNEQDGKNDSTHCHPGSNENDPRSWNVLQINNWSEGCLVFIRDEWDGAIDLIRRSVAAYGELFSITILESEDFEQAA